MPGKSWWDRSGPIRQPLTPGYAGLVIWIGATHAAVTGHSTRDEEGAEFPGTYRFCRGVRPSRPGSERGVRSHSPKWEGPPSTIRVLSCAGEPA
jgi:hypothetical protein